MKRRYVFIGAWSGKGGMYRHTCAVIEALQRDGCETGVLDCTRRPLGGQFSEMCTPVVQRSLPFSDRPFRMYRGWSEGLYDLQGGRAILVRASEGVPRLAILLALRRHFSSIYLIHHSLPRYDRWRPENEELPAPPPFRFRQRGANWLKSHLIRRIVTISERIRQSLIACYQLMPQQVVTCAQSIDADRFCPNEEVRNEMRRKMGIDRDAFVVGYVGRIDIPKAVHVVVEGFKCLVVSSPGQVYRLVLVGDGPEWEGVQTLVAKLGLTGKVDFVGWVGDTVPWHRLLDVEVSASRAEGMSISMLEAMGCGTIYLSNNLPGVREVIRHGENGFVAPLVNGVDVAGWLQHIVSLDESTRQRIRDAARRTIVGEHDTRESLPKLLGMLDVPKGES